MRAEPTTPIDGFSLAELPTELPAPHRAETPRPAARETPAIEAPHPPLGLGADPDEPLPAPVVIESTPRPPPIRVRVDQRFPTDEERANQEDPSGSVYDAIPDGQRVSVLLQWTHTAIENLRADLGGAGGQESGVLDRVEAHLYTIAQSFSAMSLSVQTLEKRVQGELLRAEQERRNSLENIEALPRWQTFLGPRHVERLYAVITFVSGIVVMGVVDYLGLESEPLFRLFAAIWGL